MRTPYQVLGLPISATKEDIRAAFQRLVSQYHPDRGGDPEAFREVMGAYEALRGDSGAFEPLPEFLVTIDGRTLVLRNLTPEFARQELGRYERWLAENRKIQQAVKDRAIPKRWKEDDPRIIGQLKPLQEREGVMVKHLAILNRLAGLG